MIILLFLSVPAMTMSGFAGDKRTTPYGDYCKDCGTYGIYKDILPLDKAKSSIKGYYQSKGYRVGNMYHQGRFIKADIYQNKKKVDKIIFDRKTGRLRSIY
jgi:hypothetical protein